MYISEIQLIFFLIISLLMLILILITHISNRKLILEKELLKDKNNSIKHSNKYSSITKLIVALYECNNELFRFNKDDLTMVIKYTNIKYRISMNNREVKFLRISNIFFKEEDSIESINLNLTEDDCHQLMMIASNVRLRSM